MQRDGKILVVLNERQVLVEVLDPAPFLASSSFIIFEEKKLDPEVASKAGTEKVLIPKGTLDFECFQEDETRAILVVGGKERRRMVERPSPFQEALSSMRGTRTVEVVEHVGRTASLNERQSVGVQAGLAGEGDYVSRV